MANVSFIELLKTTSDPIEQQIASDIITVDQLVAALPFQNLGSRDSVTFDRENALPVTVTPSAGATLTDDTALKFTKVSSFVRRFIVPQAIDILEAGSAGGMKAARGVAVSKAIKSVGRKYANDIINGNAGFTVTVNENSTGATSVVLAVGPGHDPRNPIGTIRYTHSGTTVQYKAPGDVQFGTAVTVSNGVKIYSDNADKWVTLGYSGAPSGNGVILFTISPTSNSIEIDGLLRLVQPAQIISSSTNGDAISFAALDQLLDLVKPEEGGAKILAMHSRTRRAVMALMRASGGVTWAEIRAAQFGTGLAQEADRVPLYNGVPILLSDYIPINRTQGNNSATTVVFAAALGVESGLAGTYSTAALEDDEMPPMITGPNGMVVQNLGASESTDANKVRTKAYWGLKNKSAKGLAMLDGITN